MDPFTLAAIALGGVFLFGRKSPESGRPSSSQIDVSASDRHYWLSEIRNMSHYYSDKFGSMPGLADYLTVIGYIESRFNPAAVNPQIETDPNAARGFFGIRPKTAFKDQNGLKYMRSDPNALLDPRVSFVIAVSLVWEACSKVDASQSGTPNWASIRRYWGYPSKVHDFDMSETFSVNSLKKLENGIIGVNENYGTNVDMDFPFFSVRDWKNFPGLNVLISSYGIQKRFSQNV